MIADTMAWLSITATPVLIQKQQRHDLMITWSVDTGRVKLKQQIWMWRERRASEHHWWIRNKDWWSKHNFKTLLIKVWLIKTWRRRKRINLQNLSSSVHCARLAVVHAKQAKYVTSNIFINHFLILYQESKAPTPPPSPSSPEVYHVPPQQYLSPEPPPQPIIEVKEHTPSPIIHQRKKTPIPSDSPLLSKPRQDPILKRIRSFNKSLKRASSFRQAREKASELVSLLQTHPDYDFKQKKNIFWRLSRSKRQRQWFRDEK